MAYKKPAPFSLDAFLSGNGASVYRETCPICRMKINLQTEVEEFGKPDNWIFYGKKGKRRVVCQGAIFDGTWFTHFVALTNGKVSHRIAWEKMGDCE